MYNSTHDSLSLSKRNLNLSIGEAKIKLTQWALSLNLFHGQITQKDTSQMSSPEDIKFSPWKVDE